MILILINLCVARADQISLTCSQTLLDSKSIISNKLSEIPELRDMILEMLADPLIPSNIKRILQVALLEEATVIKKLTKTLRKELKMPDRLNALHFTKDLKFSVVIDDEVSPDQIVPEDFNTSLITARQMVFIENRPITSEVNDLITLIHELSHVRFAVFLEKHLDHLIKKVPSDLIKKAEDGIFEINVEFFVYLNERYAFQTEFEVLSATVGRYFPDRYKRYKDMSARNYKVLLSERILVAYQIKDPRVVRLKDFSITEILLGVPFS